MSSSSSNLMFSMYRRPVTSSTKASNRTPWQVVGASASRCTEFGTVITIVPPAGIGPRERPVCGGKATFVSLHPLGLDEVMELFPVTDLIVTGPALGLVTLTDKSPFDPGNKVAGISCAA